MTKHRFTVDDVYLMVDNGILPPNQRVELINGELIDMSPINLPHASSVTKLDRFFSRHLSQDKYIILVQNPILLSEYSLPEPDLAITFYREELLENEHTQPQDIVLLIEVADSSYCYDRNVKYPLYATEGIPVYWIVNLNEQQIEVYTHPEGDEYTQARTYRDDFEVFGATITPHDIFPKK